MSRTHFVIPDTQSKPGTPSDHLRWIGEYILDRKPDVIIHLGDHWDMPSLSSYDRGKKAMEGRRYAEDVEKGNADLDLIMAPTRKHNAKRLTRNRYEPEWHLLRGNHENRIQRAIDDSAQLDGAIGFHDLESPGWQVHDFLQVLKLDGVNYSHYFYHPSTGRPYGGDNAETRLKSIGHSFTMGHQQGLRYGLRSTIGGMQHALIAGSAYLHEEEYLGAQGQLHWRGVVVCHQVEAGTYDPMFVSLDFLSRRYEGDTLAAFMKANYPEHT